MAQVSFAGSRFLTEEEKDAILAEGYRELDPSLRSWLDRINSLPGICTTQSCAGHKAGQRFWNAHLWLRLSEEATARFEAVALDLAAYDCIESVGRHYKSWGQEVVEIYFHGSERGRLQESQDVIFQFLARCAEGVT